ncbi:B-box domain protein 32, EMF1-Interacting Protein 6 [Hibiscus trionum]|uniref:B-box domain protein 32, EMF1-Interacting Protein 6 n=1 Tax=Hibiscus trionum TaxID=183268 RepID=A0A9W7I7B9_HIBTR|nr:B-box domain protein 32, EMF1-Interacting Protein 6 [Hibiscus trionum]
MKTGKLCELCKDEASVYCSADSAFLCWNCDHKVHRANFLVARHLRRILCSKCKSFSQSSHHLCKACYSHKPNNHPMPSSTLSFSFSSSSSSSSGSLSTSESSSNDVKRKRVCVKSRSLAGSDGLEGVLTVWCNKLGLKRHSAVSTAAAALRFCLERLKGLPFRLSLAAAFWSGLRTTRDTSGRNLRRVEELSGLPGKVIVAVEQRLARAMRLRKRIRPDLEEGWAECNA